MRNRAATLLVRSAVLVLTLGTRVSLGTEEARIQGQPSLRCTSHYAVIQLQSSEPFQGRISVIGAVDPSCTSEFSFNLNHNATAFIPLDKCTQSYFARNGSRVLQAHVDISFHPVAITNHDRVFHIQCIDNSFAGTTSLSTDPGKKAPARCTQLTRPASRWEPASFFRLGDSVVHEWNCVFDRTEHGKYHTFLTNCNAISRSGEVIHLVDENGCIVDPELLGELVYNNYTARIYGRSRMFRFASGDMYRMECQLKMCLKDSTCGPRSTPPRCAYTKVEFEKRLEMKAARNSVADFSPGTQRRGRRNASSGLPMQILLSDGGPFDHNVAVSSEWFTVHHNTYTDINQIPERFYLSSELNRSLSVTPPPAPKHFLQFISYKENTDSTSTETEEKLFEEETMRLLLNNMESAMTSPITTTASSSLSSDIFTDIGKTIDVWNTPRPALSFTPQSTRKTVTNKISVETTTETNARPRTTTITQASAPPGIQVFTTSSQPRTKPSVINNNGGLSSHVEEIATKSSSPATQSSLSTTPQTSNMVPTRRPLHKHVETEGTIPTTPEKKHDWRLDDGSFNETEVITINCLNSTNAGVSESKSPCRWSGLEHLLLAWSLFSLAGWAVLLTYAVYKYHCNRPEWVEFRPPSSSHMGTVDCRSKAAQGWVHPDAFEQRLRSPFRGSIPSSRESYS